MIKSVKFENFRNLNQTYNFNNRLNVIIGKNNSGKTNVLEGIKIAFSIVTGDYCKIYKSDFKDSDDSNPIIISIELENDSITSLKCFEEDGTQKCGFKVIIRKTNSNRYAREIYLINDGYLDMDVLRNDINLPNLYMIPLMRIEDIFNAGLTTGIAKFIESEERYKKIKDESKEKIKEELKDKIDEFKALCSKFNEEMDIDLSDPKITDEKIFITNNPLGHGTNIGSGYKSIANILLNTLDKNFNIILIDEIENHLHPALIRTLIRELRNIENTIIISTTHSSVVINEMLIGEIIDISGKNINGIGDKVIIDRLNNFLTPGRNELMLGDNIIIVEGYTEEILLKNYLRNNNNNWTVVNVDGVMFKPYILLSIYLNKRVIVISDNDKSKNNGNRSDRFSRLLEFCNEKNIKVIEVENTLESDLYINGYMSTVNSLLKEDGDYKVAKDKKKTEIAQHLIEENIDLSEWHVIRELEDEFNGN